MLVVSLSTPMKPKELLITAGITFVLSRIPSLLVSSWTVEEFNNTSVKVPESLRRLYFTEEQNRLDNDMIQPEVQSDNIMPEEARKLVFTYFELLVDDEIDPSELCENIRDIKRENLYVDDDLICPQDEDPRRFDIYATRVTADDLEDCD